MKGFLRRHERLRTPSRWGSEERSFVVQLERLFDTLFNRRIEKIDLASELAKELDGKLGQPINLDSGDDCNDATEPGLYTIGSGVANSPKDWCGMLVIRYNSAVYQVAYSRDRVYVRDYTGDPPSWGPWQPVSLMMGTMSNGKDLNTVTSPGFYLLASNYTYTNMPSGSYAVLVLRSSSTATAVCQVCFRITTPPCCRVRTATDTWTNWLSFADDSKVVHNTGNETIAGTKTFTSALLFERGASAPGTAYSVLRARFKSQDGSVQFEVVPVKIIGSDAASNVNGGVVIGSNTGITIVGAGESSATFASKNSIYNGEDLYLVSDGFVRIYTGVADDGTVKGYYQFPVLAEGTALDMSKAASMARPPVIIPKNSDLDDYKTPGSYEIYDSTYAATIAHCPWTGCGGRIDVFDTYRTNGAYVRQIGHRGGGYSDTYIREASGSGVFGAWYKINTTAM